MRTIILIEEARVQLVLQPENKHDKSVLDVLEKMPQTHRVTFYQTQGGWTARRPIYSDSMYGKADNGEDLLIVFDEPPKPDDPDKGPSVD
jgi:hypothetical protein